jgi:hypothetical protein
MVDEGMSPEQAMIYTMNVVSRDPNYDSSLSCFTR